MTDLERAMHTRLAALGAKRTPEQERIFARLDAEKTRAEQEDAAWASNRGWDEAQTFLASHSPSAA